MKKTSGLHGLSPSLRFTMPVIFENIFTSVINLVFSAILGGISASSLAAAGTGNQIMNLITAFFSIIITGASVLVALNTGKQDRAQTARVVEQSVLLVPVISVFALMILYAVSSPVMRVLMPGADDAFFAEGLEYYRMMILSLPGLAATNVFSSILRAAGDSRAALFCTLFSNAVQILSAVLFVSVLELGISGAGLSYIVCRYIGAAALLFALSRHRRHFEIRLGKSLIPDKRVICEILRVGLPSVVDGIAVHGGYVLINSLLIDLGKEISSVYNVIVALIGFSGISQAIVSTSVTTISGQQIGAGFLLKARKSHMRIMLMGIAFSALISVVMLIFPSFFAGLFTRDSGIRSESAKVVWLSLLFVIPAVGVNASEPAARVGGMGKGVMISASACVWLIRVPLTWLFCYPLDMGVTGVYLANTVSCYVRLAVAVFMIRSEKWGKKTV